MYIYYLCTCMSGKKQYVFFFLIGICIYTSLLFSSCKTKEDPKPSPTITRELPAKDTITVDSLQTIDIKYQFNSANESIKLWKYQTTFYLTTPKLKIVNYQFQTGRKTIDSIAGKVSTYTLSDQIIVADTVKQNQLYKVVTSIWDKQKIQVVNIFYFKIKKTNIKTYFKDTVNVDRIANLTSKEPDCSLLPAYDFVNKTPLAANAPSLNIDMINSNTVTDTSQLNYAVFSPSWKSMNGTKFVKADTSFKYETALVEDVEKAFNKNINAQQSGIIDASVGEVYLVKLRGQEIYMILQVTDIIDDLLTIKEGGNNCDYLQFKYKKK